MELIFVFGALAFVPFTVLAIKAIRQEKVKENAKFIKELSAAGVTARIY